jgi:hypothetical protein
MPRLRNPIVADLAPSGPALTKYDEEHAVTYVRTLDADADEADWPDVHRSRQSKARIFRHISPAPSGRRARDISCSFALVVGDIFDRPAGRLLIPDRGGITDIPQAPLGANRRHHGLAPDVKEAAN